MRNLRNERYANDYHSRFFSQQACIDEIINLRKQEKVNLVLTVSFSFVVISEFTISDPMFYDENSYMSFTPVFTKLSINIKLQLKPSTLDGIIFYVAKQLHSYSGDFLSLVLLAGKAQLRYHLGDKLNVLSSSTEIKSDTGKVP